MPPIQKETWKIEDYIAWLRNRASYDENYAKVLDLSQSRIGCISNSIGNLRN